MSTDTEHCPLTCKVKMENLECDHLRMITLVFNNYHSSKAITCFNHDYESYMHLIINCQSWGRGKCQQNLTKTYHFKEVANIN